MNNKPQQSIELFLLDLAEAIGHTSKRDESYGAPFAMTCDEALERASELLEERDEYRSLYKNVLAKLVVAQSKLADAWDEGKANAHEEMGCDWFSGHAIENPYKAGGK